MKLISDISLEDITFNVSENKNWSINNDKDNLEFYSNEIFEIVFEPYTNTVKGQTEIFINIKETELQVFLRKIEKMYTKIINEIYSEKEEYNLSYTNISDILKLKFSLDKVVCHDSKFNYIPFNKDTLKKGNKIKIGMKTYGPWFLEKNSDYSEKINVLYGVSFFVKNIQIT